MRPTYLRGADRHRSAASDPRNGLHHPISIPLGPSVAGAAGREWTRQDFPAMSGTIQGLGEIMLGLFLGLGSTALALGLGVGLALTIGLALGSAALGLGLLISDAAIKYDIDELED
ncbi:hypothetical protein ABIC28_005223 [Rhodococcus sp. PvR044]|jgi:hypothetical protein|uniref:hypothetical protein n=1 Tax=Rhodococcus TaxID=1827 RepID=UPI00117B24A3|nr:MULTISPECIES: hypothetical protein [Rhodococcus]MBP1159448.1 hypothetical protein [Rhodococcus sp. PvR099]MCZ4556712.1 hypothetical protein [Rhodococcus maanshanensis]